MEFFISKEFNFDAAHQLTEYHGKCENLHGHTYKLRVTLKGHIDSKGMIIDFTILKNIVKEKVIEKLDHRFLNEIVPKSTAENIALWIWSELKPILTSPNYNLYEIILWETETSFVCLREDK